VSRIDMEEGELTVDFDGREVTYGFGELDEVVLAYATTIHKSQGSEYPAVVIPLSTGCYAAGLPTRGFSSSDESAVRL
jgi:exodeoxyribonuclease V alpha subunit